MSASLMSCVRQSSPPLELESGTAVEIRASNAPHSGSQPSLFADEQHTGSPIVVTSAAAVAAAAAAHTDDASSHSNTQKRRRRFQPLRKLRRIFRMSSGPDDATSVGASSSVYKPTSEPDFGDEPSIGMRSSAPARALGDTTVRLVDSQYAPPQRPHRESRQRSQHPPTTTYDQHPMHSHPHSHHQRSERRASQQHSSYHGGKPVLHLRQDSRESLYRDSSDHQSYHHHQHTSSHHHQHSTAHHQNHQPHRMAGDAVDFQSSSASAASKRRSNSDCLADDLKSEALSQSHDSVFSESVTASSISIGLKAELSSVLAKKYAIRRASTERKDSVATDKHGTDGHDDDDVDDDDDEDLGLPRSPNTPMRGTRTLTVSSRTSTVTSPSSRSHQAHHTHVSSDGSMSMLSMESSEHLSSVTRSTSRMRLGNRYQSETDTDIGLPVTVLNHSAARHKMAVRPKRKQAPSRLSRVVVRTGADVLDATTATPEEDGHEAAMASRRKSSSLPPGLNANQLPLHAVNRTVIAVNETTTTATPPKDLYANRSLAKSFDFDATPTEKKTRASNAEKDGKEPNGFFRRLLTYGSLKKKSPAVAPNPKHIAEVEALNTHLPPKSAAATKSTSTTTSGPPEIRPKPAIKTDKPRTGPGSRQRVQPRELIVNNTPTVPAPTVYVKHHQHHHSSEKLPPISPSIKKVHDAKGSNECVVSIGRMPSAEHVAAVPAQMPKSDDGPKPTKRSSVELPSRAFDIDSAKNTAAAGAFPQYRSDEQLFPRKKSTTSFNMPAPRFSSTSCIMRTSTTITSGTAAATPSPSSLHIGGIAKVAPGSVIVAAVPSSNSPSRRLVEKSKSFRFYADTSGESSMHSSAGHMPSLPDLSCWSSSSNSAALATDSPRSGGTGHSPNHRELINKFEINDNNLVQRTPAKAAVAAADTTTATPRDSRNTVFVTTCEPTIAVRSPGELLRPASVMTPIAMKTTVVTERSQSLAANITQIEDNIDRIMKFACVTILNSPVVGQQPQSQQSLSSVDERRFSNESVVIETTTKPPAADATPAVSVERRPSVSDERLKFERRIQSEAEALSPSPSIVDVPDTNGNVTAAVAAAPNSAVVLRKKSGSCNCRPHTHTAGITKPMQSAKSVASGINDDQTPELMKVFARRSLKLKDTFYVTDEPMSMTPSDSLPDVVSLTDSSVISHNNDASSGSCAAVKAIVPVASKIVTPAVVAEAKTAAKLAGSTSSLLAASTALATAWIGNYQPIVGGGGAATSKVSGMRSSSTPVVQARNGPKAVFNNNVMFSNNNNNHNHISASGAAAVAPDAAEDQTNANIADAGGETTAPGNDVQLRQSSSVTDGSSAADEFKGISQRKAEWEKRATQQFK